MNKQTQIIGPDGKMHDVTVIGVSEATEHWSNYTLADGTKIRAKLVVLDFMRYEHLTNPDGSPLYAMKSQNVLAVDETQSNAETTEH